MMFFCMHGFELLLNLFVFFYFDSTFEVICCVFMSLGKHGLAVTNDQVDVVTCEWFIYVGHG